MVLRRNRQPESRPRQRQPQEAPAKQTYPYYNRPRRTPGDTAAKAVDLGQVGRRLKLLPTFLAVAVIVGSLLYSLTISVRPTVIALEDQASPYRSLEAYADEAERLIGQSPGNRTKLTIDAAKVERQLMERFPELNAVVLRLPVLGRRPSLIVDIRPPVLVLASSARSLVIDGSGVAVCELKDLAEDARRGLMVVQDQSGLDLAAGRQALPSGTVKFVSDAVDHLTAEDLEISQLVLPPSANQLDIHLSGVRYYVKTDTAGDARLQIGSFLAVKDDLAEKGITAQEYVDVRVEEKVFYK